jgi:hypothetical protein
MLIPACDTSYFVGNYTGLVMTVPSPSTLLRSSQQSVQPSDGLITKTTRTTQAHSLRSHANPLIAVGDLLRCKVCRVHMLKDGLGALRANGIGHLRCEVYIFAVRG